MVIMNKDSMTINCISSLLLEISNKIKYMTAVNFEMSSKDLNVTDLK